MAKEDFFDASVLDAFETHRRASRSSFLQQHERVWTLILFMAALTAFGSLFANLAVLSDAIMPKLTLWPVGLALAKGLLLGTAAALAMPKFSGKSIAAVTACAVTATVVFLVSHYWMQTQWVDGVAENDRRVFKWILDCLPTLPIVLDAAVTGVAIGWFLRDVVPLPWKRVAFAVVAFSTVSGVSLDWLVRHGVAREGEGFYLFHEAQAVPVAIVVLMQFAVMFYGLHTTVQPSIGNHHGGFAESRSSRIAAVIALLNLKRLLLVFLVSVGGLIALVEGIRMSGGIGHGSLSSVSISPSPSEAAASTSALNVPSASMPREIVAYQFLSDHEWAPSKIIKEADAIRLVLADGSYVLHCGEVVVESTSPQDPHVHMFGRTSRSNVGVAFNFTKFVSFPERAKWVYSVVRDLNAHCSSHVGAPPPDPSAGGSVTLYQPRPKAQAQTAGTPIVGYGTREPRSYAAASLPPFQYPLEGANEIRVQNPNDFGVSVQVRTGAMARNFDVAPSGVSSAIGPDGAYEIFFIYSNQPDALFQGDSFTLSGNGVEIRLVSVTDGNYRVRRVR